MTIRAYVVIGSIFVAAFALLGIGHCGYKDLDAMQSLEKKSAQIRKDFPEVEHISSGTVAALLQNEANSSVLLIDCRKKEEVEVSRIPGAVHFESAKEVMTHLATQSVTPDSVIVYCSVGQRSAELTKDLQKAGVKNAKNFVGSIFQWANEDRPLVDGQGETVQTVHPFNKFWGTLLKKERRAEP